MTNESNKTSKELAVITPNLPFAPVSDDPLGSYLKQISVYPLLDLKEERELALELKKTGDLEIAKKLVLHNLRLVVKIAMEYRSAWQNTMDLIQEGNIGLMKAVSKYDPDKGAKLSYYASWWIRSYVLKFILDNFRLVKIGTTNEQKKLFYNLMREKNALLSQGRPCDTKTIANNLGVSEKAVTLMESRLHNTEIPFNRPTSESSDGPLSPEEVYGDAEQQSIEDALADKQGLKILQDNMQGFLDGLGERDRQIFQERLLQEIPSSLQSIADQYGVSRERIRQIEERLKKNLKVYMSNHLR